MKNITQPITNDQDVIDSRDIIERLEDLENDLQGYYEEYTENGGELSFEDWLSDEDIEDYQDEKHEFNVLTALTDDAEGYSPDWQYGSQLIRDSYFAEYAEELCKDTGDIPKDLPWYIEKHIDWEGVSKEIQMDYTSVDFDGEEYWVR